MLTDGIPFISSALIVETAPVIFRLVVFPYATTTVSSNAWTSSSITMRSVSLAVFSENSIIFFLKPTKENSSVPFTKGNSIANRPFSFVAVPTGSPTTFTVTPGIGSFFSSTTFPTIRKLFRTESCPHIRGCSFIITRLSSKVNPNPNLVNKSSRTTPNSLSTT